MNKLAVAALFCLAMFGCQKKDPEPEPAPVPVPDVVIPTPPAPHQVTVIQSESGRKYYTGLLHTETVAQLVARQYVSFADEDCENLPDEFDLRPLGLVDDVRDQGSCGSCWSFSMTGSLASAMRGVGKIFDLSEQEIVSCDRSNYGCGGGNMNGFSYQIQHGQGLEADFPYTASNSRCKAISVAAKGISYQYVGSSSRSPTEKELKCALFKSKTVPWITVSADGDWGSPPSSEHTLWSRCGRGTTNHAIGVVGWHTINGKTGFIAKNSWGDEWGDNGYASIPLGCDSFGDEVGYVQVAQPTPPPPPPTPVPPGPTPTPDPCIPPVLKLPSVIVVVPGVEVMLGVKDNPQWKMEWFVGGQKVGEGSMLYVKPEVDTVYKLVAVSECGRAESSVKVSLLVSKKK